MQIFKRSRLNIEFLCLLALIMNIACQNNLNQKEESSQTVASDSLSAQEILYDEVMEIHDEVMPAMSDIMSLNRQLKIVGDSSARNSEAINQLSARLENASEGMMNWMRNFNPKLETATSEETLNYLEEEKQKIKLVKVEMEQAIEAAEEYLNSKKRPLQK